MEADGPVAPSGGARDADNVELHVPAHRMPLQRIGDTDLDLVERCGGFCKIFLEIHCASLRFRSWPGSATPGTDFGDGMVNGALNYASRRSRSPCPAAVYSASVRAMRSAAGGTSVTPDIAWPALQTSRQRF